VQQAQAEGAPFDAVILDLTIPGGQGGQETLARLRAIDAGIKAVASSGYSNDPIMVAPQQYGFAARLNKPYQRVELDRVLREVLGESAAGE
jgi:CheY-like chemotaxis protein